MGTIATPVSHSALRLALLTQMREKIALNVCAQTDQRVASALAEVMAERGPPMTITVDNTAN